MRMRSMAVAMAAIAAAVAGFFFLFVQESAAQAAKIRVLASNGVKAVMDELLPQGERAIGRPLTIEFSTTASIKQRIEAGEAFDVVIVTSEAIDDLIKAGKITSGSRANLASSGIGIGIRRGAPKPDIRTPEALKRALTNAKSLTYAEDGASRIHIEKMLERLGIAANVRSKTVLTQGSARGLAAVAAGQGDLAMTLISEILPVEGIDLAGPLPADFQNYVRFAAGIGAKAANAEAGRALIKFLTGPTVAPSFKAKGMEPSIR